MRDFGDCELRRGHPGNKSMADTFLGTSWTGVLPPWLLIGWELPRGMHRRLPMESRGNDLQLSHRGTKWQLFWSLKKRGMEQECTKKPITLFLSCFSFCLSLLFAAHLFLFLYYLYIIQSPSFPPSPWPS